MKTSNKILLGTFLTAILIIVSVHVALFAKYKKGQYTLITDDMWPTNFLTQSFQNVQYVSVSDLLVTVEAGDSTKLHYQKSSDDSIFRFLQKGDTLFLTRTLNDAENHRNWNPTLRLTLPRKNKLIAKKCYITFVGLDAPGSFSSGVSLDQTELVFQPQEFGKRGYFDNVTVNATNDSQLRIGDANFKTLRLLLNNSLLEDTGAYTDSLFIATDPRSKFTLKAENLLKAKISSNE